VNPLPPQLEAALLDFVEGQPMRAADRSAIDAAAAENPQLAALIRGMQADRAALQAFAVERAPAGLLGRVEAVLEREALVGLATAEHNTPTHLPTSLVLPPQRATGLGRWRAPFAVAAAVAVVTAGAYVLIRGSVAPKPTGRDIAGNTTTGGVTSFTPDLHAADGSLTAAPLPFSGEGLPTSAASGTLASNEPTSDAAPPAAAPSTEVAVAAASEASIPFGMNLAEALELAREGRLLITVVAPSTDAAVAALDRLPNKHLGDGRETRVVPIDLAAASSFSSRLNVELAARFSSIRLAGSNGQESGTPRAFSVVSGSPDAPRPPLPIPGAEGADPGTASAPAVAPRVFAVELGADARALRATLRALARSIAPDAPAELMVQLSALPPGVESPCSAPATDAGSILWWTSPSTWSAPASAPVVLAPRTVPGR
jgi:hypothetical protein